MIARLEGNPVGQALAAFLAVLVLVLVLLAGAWSLPPTGSREIAGDDERELSADIPNIAGTAPIEAFAVIVDRPVFNESRQPEVYDTEGSEEEGEGLADGENPADVNAPEVALTGVVITPSLRIVTLKPKDAAESLISIEGGPLEGSYGSWQVSTIEPRSVVLKSESGQEVRYDLQMHDAVIAEPPKPAPPQETTSEAAGDDEDRPLTRAEEIRQRIAERREELRRAAEENQQVEPAKPTYQEAIQQMIQGSRKNQSDENEQ